MHELSLCRALLKQLAEVMRRRPGTRIERVHVRVGPLSGVVPALLAHAFQVARADSVAPLAELVVEICPVRVRCQACATDSDALPNRLRCPRCGSAQTQLLSGTELELESVDLVPEEESPTCA